MSKALEAARELVKILEEKENNKVELSTLQPGETFKIGEHDFIVLHQSLSETSVISKNFMAEDVKFDDESKDYNESSLKELIERDIQPIIEQEVGADNIVKHIVELTSVDMQHQYDECTCKVRPITFDEARQYNNLLVNKEIGDWWCTCTPWSTEERGCKYSMAVVSPSGGILNFNYNYDIGVRPFCILKSNIFVSKGEQGDEKV